MLNMWAFYFSLFYLILQYVLNQKNSANVNGSNKFYNSINKMNLNFETISII